MKDNFQKITSQLAIHDLELSYSLSRQPISWYEVCGQKEGQKSVVTTSKNNSKRSYSLISKRRYSERGSISIVTTWKDSGEGNFKVVKTLVCLLVLFLTHYSTNSWRIYPSSLGWLERNQF